MKTMTQHEARQRITRLTPITDVLARIEGLARPVAPRELALADAEGRVLAADLFTSHAVPRAPLALRDGWAVQADMVADAGPYAPMPLGLASAWVNAGDPMPSPADAVLSPDAVTEGGHGAEAHASATAGDGVLMPGADATPNIPLRRAGERLRAVDVAGLQLAGFTRVMVREPRVRVVSTAEASTDTAALMIARAVSAAGGSVIFVHALERALADENTDAVISIGGTGEGRDDKAVALLARAGEVHAHGFGIAPGETAALGAVATRPVLMLPGRIDAAMAVFLLAGNALLSRLTGAAVGEPAGSLQLTRKIVSTVGLAEVVPVRRFAGSVEPLASGHWPLQALTRADGWVLVPPESEGFAAGTMVEVRPFP
jgi:molybdopterin molybdotransferase